MLDRRTAAVVLAVAVAVASTVAVAYFLNLGKGAEKPHSGFLIIASSNGYNDSIHNGAGQRPWPIINVQKGTNVTISVYNADHQAHGFQVLHYFDSSIETVAPGQTVTVSFVADEAGTFRIFCSIFCTVHVYMQSGELVVT